MLDELKKIGLSENEAKVYLALLELGSSTVQQIAQKAAIKRPTAYVQLESLMKQGLVTNFEKEKRAFFRAEDPEYLKKVVEKNKKQAEEETAVLEKILPDLGKLFLTAGERPRVRFFEGVEGVRSMQNEYLKSGSQSGMIVNILSADNFFKFFPQHAEEYTPQRVKRGIRSKLIYTSSRGPFLKNSDDASLRESRFIPPDEFPFPGDITIYGDFTAFSVLREPAPFGIIIESKEVADSMRALFDKTWEASQRHQK